MSELHQRLTHLVNYSSQLIFVSGNSVAEQQRYMSDFLANQPEHTEIAFFSASPDKEVSEYRGAICRQLAGHVVGSFIRPLSQLLSEPERGLNPENGPYLVCITEAEHLDNSFLQELWDWVMSVHKIHSSLHVNVLLFGETQWANESQEWLPSQNSSKPVLLSTETLEPSGFDVKTLERLIANDAMWQHSKTAPLIAKKRFIGGVLVVFLGLFVALMAWQQPQHLQTLLALTSKQSVTESADANQEEQSPVTLIASAEASEATDDSYTDTVLASNWTSEEPSEKSAEPEASVLQDSTLDDANLANLPQEQLGEQLEQQVIEQEQIASDTTEQTPIVLEPESDIQTPQTQGQGEQLANEIPTSEIPNETPTEVEDVSSAENLAPTSIESEQDYVAIEQTAIEQQQSAEENAERIEDIENSDSSFQYDEQYLLDIANNAFFLQLAGMRDQQLLNTYLRRADIVDTAYAYKTMRNGEEWFVVLHNQSYSSIAEATTAIQELPAALQQAQPFVKRLSQVKREISNQ